MFIVFDLDGTLSLPGRRLELISGPRKDYDAFYAACGEDEPNWPAIRAMHAHLEGGDHVEIWTGRREDVREATLNWCRRHGVAQYIHLLGDGPIPVATPGIARWWVPARMRPADDYRPDVDLKRAWLAELRAAGRPLPDLAYEDRDRVVAMWREEGVACFQVAPGAY